MTRLAGRLAVVTGASRGIGWSTAQALAAEGATVVRLARTLAGPPPPGMHDLVADLSRPEAVETAARTLLERWGTPDILVHSAGAFVLRPFDETTLADFDGQYAINLRAPFLLTRALVPAMRAAGGGLIVLVGSVCDHVGFPGNSAYSASKFGLRGLYEVLRAEFAGTGLRVSLVSPGSTDTDIWDPIDPDHREGFTPRARMLRPGDVADAIVYVATRPASVSLDWVRLVPTSE